MEQQFEIGEEVVAYIPEINTWAKGKVFMRFNDYHTYIDFGNLYFALIPQYLCNVWSLDNTNIRRLGVLQNV